MKVVLEHGNDERYIGEAYSLNGAYDVIVAFLDRLNVSPYYYRMWELKDGVRYIDYGSHTKFFKIYPDE